MKIVIRFLIIIIFFYPAKTFCQNELQFVSLADFKTTDGHTIHNCKIGFRTIGKLNDKRSNAVLWTTWFSGTSADIYRVINGLMDTSGLYIVIADALTNGVSSSPSTSRDFSNVSIRDMVNSQYRLLTEHIKLDHVKAIMGYSMGAMQALEWSVAYPVFMDKIVSISGTPKQSFYDILFWNTQIKLIEKAKMNPGETGTLLETVADIWTMNLYTPNFYAVHENADSISAYLEKIYKNPRLQDEDYLAGIKAIIKQDIYKYGNLKQLIRAKVLFIVSEQDHIVNPLASIELAKQLNAPVLILITHCGHLALFCEPGKIKRAVSSFL